MSIFISTRYLKRDISLSIILAAILFLSGVGNLFSNFPYFFLLVALIVILFKKKPYEHVWKNMFGFSRWYISYAIIVQLFLWLGIIVISVINVNSKVLLESLPKIFPVLIPAIMSFAGCLLAYNLFSSWSISLEKGERLELYPYKKTIKIVILLYILSLISLFVLRGLWSGGLKF